MTIITYDLDKLNALKARIAELEAQLAEQDTRAVNPYPMSYYSRTAYMPITLFDQPGGRPIAVIIPDAVVHVDLGNSTDGFHRAMISGYVQEIDRLEGRTE